MKGSFKILSFLLLMNACKTGNVHDKLPGVWMLEKVYEYNQDVTKKHNPMSNRWIEFNKDGTFISDGDPFGRNTGHWKIDPAHSILFIDSQTEDDDSEWKIAFTKDQMVWTGIGHPRKENTRLVHKRK